MHRRVLGVAATLTAAFGLVIGFTGAVSADHHQESQHRGSSGYTEVAVAPPVYDLLGSSGITLEPLGNATAKPLEDTVAARFPIKGFKARGLTIRHAGGLRLSSGDKRINLRSFDISLRDFSLSGKVSGSIGRVGRVDLFRVGISDRFDLGWLSLRLKATSADALNTTFGVDAFAKGDVFGYATPRPFAGIDHLGLVSKALR